MSNTFMSVEQVATELGVSKSYAYFDRRHCSLSIIVCLFCFVRHTNYSYKKFYIFTRRFFAIFFVRCIANGKKILKIP